MTYYCYGFVLGCDPSNVGGGFIVANDKGEIVKRQIVYKDYFTGNEAGVIAILYAISIAGIGDSVVSSNDVCVRMVNRGKSKTRKDLYEILSAGKSEALSKSVSVRYVTSNKNVARTLNEGFTGETKKILVDTIHHFDNSGKDVK